MLKFKNIFSIFLILLFSAIPAVQAISKNIKIINNGEFKLCQDDSENQDQPNTYEPEEEENNPQDVPQAPEQEQQGDDPVTDTE